VEVNEVDVGVTEIDEVDVTEVEVVKNVE